jgi:hypothetical protein
MLEAGEHSRPASRLIRAIFHSARRWALGMCSGDRGMAMPRVRAGMASDADALVQDLDGRVGDRPKLLVTGMASLQ